MSTLLQGRLIAIYGCVGRVGDISAHADLLPGARRSKYARSPCQNTHFPDVSRCHSDGVEGGGLDTDISKPGDAARSRSLDSAAAAEDHQSLLTVSSLHTARPGGTRRRSRIHAMCSCDAAPRMSGGGPAGRTP